MLAVGCSICVTCAALREGWHRPNTRGTAADAAAAVVAESQAAEEAQEAAAAAPTAPLLLDPAVRMYLESTAEQLIATQTAEVRGGVVAC